jgi:hypothetical protein
MRCSPWLLTLLSLLNYIGIFWYVDHFWWSTFLFLVPIFYAALTTRLSWFHGLFWGAGLVIAQALPVAHTFMEKNYGLGLNGILCGIACALYFGTYGALYFWLASATDKLFNGASRTWITALMWSVYGVLFFMSLDCISLWHIGLARGYCLMHPLLPLAYYPPVVAMLPYLGKTIMTFLLFITNAALAIAMVKKNMTSWAVWGCCIGFWIMSSLLGSSRQQAPEWHERIGYLPKKISSGSNLSRMAREIAQDMRELISQYPTVDLIILPESALNSGSILTAPEAFSSWSAENLGRAVHVIFGALRWYDEFSCNTLYWLYNSAVQAFYDKHCLVPLFEVPGPAWMDALSIPGNFFCPESTFASSGDVRVPLPIFSSVSFIPYVCSELYLDHGVTGMDPEYPLVAILNEMSLPSYYQRLMHIGARLRAIEWQRDIVYVSYKHGDLMGKYGEMWPLQGL